MRVSDAATLQLAMRGARLGSWTRDLVTQEIRWTPELEMLFGLTPGTLRGSREEFFGFVHPDDRDRLRQSVDEAIDNRRDYECEFRIQHTSGDWRWMIGRGRAEYHADGTPLRLHGIALDVTDTRRAELARDRLAAIVESATAAIISKQLDGTITSWNTGAVRLFGYLPEEMIGSSIFRLVPPELHHEEHEVLRRLRGGERIEDYETVRISRDGRRRHVQLAVSPVRNSAGEIIGGSKIAFSIDARREAEQRLREEAHALEMVNRVGRAVAAELEVDRVVQLVTDAATELSGASFGAFFYNVIDDERGHYWLYAMSGADRSAFAHLPMPRTTEVFAPTFSGEGVIRSDDIRSDPRYGKNQPHLGMPQGHLPVVSYLAVPVVARHGEVLGGLFFGHAEPGVFTERAERIVTGIAAQAAIAIDNARLYQATQRELEARTAAEGALRESELRLKAIADEREALLASERAARSEAERLSHVKDEFLATLSHELRTPLNAIQGWSVLMRQAKLGDADRERGLASIERNTRAQAKIIDDLLDMSRIVAGKIHLEVHDIELHTVVEAAIEAVKPAADARRVSIQALLDTRIGITRGDPNRLQQVFWNLLTNAVKFTPPEGNVQVVLERVDSNIEILVQDSGVGIRPEFLPHVFDRFRQADASITRRYGGLGLGLSIVRNLVELHGGSVRAESAGENAGSTFVVSLPIALGGHERRRHGNALRAPNAEGGDRHVLDLPSLDGIRVLVVDDERDTRELLQQIIVNRGGTTQLAGSAAEALSLVERREVDLLVSDIGMPDVDGFELIRRVRAAEGRENRTALPAIAVTAYARAEDRNRCLLAGYQLHLTKPVEPRDLVTAIASLISARQA